MDINAAFNLTKLHFQSNVGWIPIGWVGPSGVGKTTMAKKLAGELGKEFVYLPVRTDDVLGINLPNKGNTEIEFVPHKRLKPAIDKPAIVYLDEVNRCDRYSRFALMELTGERTIGGYKLHPETNIIITCNDESEENDVNEVDNPFKTRIIPVPILGTLADTVKYAEQEQLPMLQAFFTRFPNLLNKEISWEMKADRRFITYLSLVHKEGAIPPAEFQEIVKFSLGKEYGQVFLEQEIEPRKIFASNSMETFCLGL